MPISSSKLEYVRGTVIGIGRVIVPRTCDFDWEIPLLSFVVTEKKEGGYISSCIHLQVDGYGKTEQDAQIDMVENITNFLTENFKGDYGKNHGWENMLDLFLASEDSSSLWDLYHTFQMILAEQGYSTHQYPSLEQMQKFIQRLTDIEKRVADLEAKVKQCEESKQQNIFAMERRAIREKQIVQYTHSKSII